MAQIPRPPKQGNVMTYVAKVAAGYPHILAGEMDADLDTIYGAWNSGADTVNIRDGAITSAKLAADSVGPRELQDSGVGTSNLADASVTTPKIADGAVTMAKLVGGGIPGGSVGAAQIIDGSVGTAELADGAVTDPKIVSVAWGKVTGAPAAFPPSGAAGGSLSGTYPNPAFAMGSASQAVVVTSLPAPVGLTATEAFVVQANWTAVGGRWLVVAALHGHIFLPYTPPQIVGVTANLRFDGTANAPGDGFVLSSQFFSGGIGGQASFASIVPFSICLATGGQSTPGAHFLKLTAHITGNLTGTGIGANGIDSALITLFETT